MIGLAVSTSNEPADPANTIGISMCAAGTRIRAASTTTMGNSAAAAPFRVISALTTDVRAITAIRTTAGRLPTRASNACPAHVVTPAESIPSLTTKSAAMKMTTGSPKPASAESNGSTPVAYRPSAVSIATEPTGKRFQTKSTMSASRISKLMVA